SVVYDPISTAMRRARSFCCASTASGYAANVASIKVRNSRRLMGLSKGRRRKSSTFFLRLLRRKGRLHVRFGSKADMCGAEAHVRFGPIADMEQLRSFRK